MHEFEAISLKLRQGCLPITFLNFHRRQTFVYGYEAWVRFGTRVQVQVRDSAIPEKVGCGCGGTRRLKNY